MVTDYELLRGGNSRKEWTSPELRLPVPVDFGRVSLDGHVIDHIHYAVNISDNIGLFHFSRIVDLTAQCNHSIICLDCGAPDTGRRIIQQRFLDPGRDGRVIVFTYVIREICFSQRCIAISRASCPIWRLIWRPICRATWSACWFSACFPGDICFCRRCLAISKICCATWRDCCFPGDFRLGCATSLNKE